MNIQQVTDAENHKLNNEENSILLNNSPEDDNKNNIQTREQVEQQSLQEATEDFWNDALEITRKQYDDIDDAVKFLMEHKDKHLQKISFIDKKLNDPEYREEMLKQELNQIIHISALQEKNPAEMVYKLAQVVGYQNSNAIDKQTAMERAKTLTASNGTTLNIQDVDNLINMDLADFHKALNRVGGDLRKFL